MLSFEEFQAVNNRDKKKINVVSGKPQDKKRSDDLTKTVAGNEAETGDPGWRYKLGEALEHPSFQSLLACLLVLDIFSAYLLAVTGRFSHIPIIPHVMNGSRIFCLISNIIFAMELLAVYIAFGLRSMVHLGYLTDFIVIGCQVYMEMDGLVLEGKILSFLRFWRFLRLYNILVDIEKKRRLELQGDVSYLESKIRELSVEKDSFKVEIEKQKESMASVEKLLQNYKDEVDTLNEALKIAAMDIAEVAQDDDEISSDEEPDEDASLRQLIAKRKNVAMNEATDKFGVLKEMISIEHDQASSAPASIRVYEGGEYDVR